jgi:putative hemolysin
MPDVSPDLLLFFPVVLALLLRALLVAGEAALGGVGQERAEELAEASWGGRLLARLKSDAERTHGGVRAGLALTLVIAAALAALVAVQVGRAQQLPAAWDLAFAVAGALCVWLSSVLTDALPRSLASSHPEPWALWTAPVLLMARELLAPLTRLVTAVVDLVLRPFGVKTRFSAPPPPLEEIQRLLETSPQVGAPEPALVQSLFSFAERTVKEIMVPRTDVVAVPHDASPDELLQRLVEEGHTRVPVYRETLDTIIGLIHIKDVLPLLTNPELIILHDLLRPVPFVPWNSPIPKVMRDLQRKRQHFAVVVDEYGGVAGIVTLEDIVEQIVGDIRDEFDEEASALAPAADGTSLVPGDLRVAEFNRTFDADVPEDQGYETLGGFLCSLAGALPAEGDRFYQGGFELQVLRRDPRRVLEVKVTRTKPPAESTLPAGR